VHLGIFFLDPRVRAFTNAELFGAAVLVSTVLLQPNATYGNHDSATLYRVSVRGGISENVVHF